MCVDIRALIATLLYFAVGLIFNRYLIDYDSDDDFIIWLLLFWPVLVAIYACVWLSVYISWIYRHWFKRKE